MSSAEQQFKTLYDLVIKERPQLADAIVWLQGDRYDRALKVSKLYKDAWAKKIVVSGNNVLVGNKIRAEENNISLDKMRDCLLKKGVKNANLIIERQSLNTKEQAEHILNIAVNKKWSKLILVGSSYCQPRALLTFLKQAEKMKWQGKIINQPALIGWERIPAGRTRPARFLFSQEFEKIKRYRKDLVSIDRGIEYLNREMFNLRNVAASDARLLFKWINDPDARINARNSKIINWDEHASWFARKLPDKYTHIYILVGLKKNIGVIRFEQKGKEFIISYSIDRKYRGRGFGSLILEMGMEKIYAMTNRPVFIAYVKKNNTPSEKIFKKSGFTLKKKKIIDGNVFSVYQK